MPEKRDDSSPFFRARPGEWAEIETATLSEVIHLQGLLAAIVGSDVERRPAPLEVALKLNEIASALFDQLAGEERDLRQVISTLRTAHAVAWDMHDAVQATRTTVEQHMEKLRATIDDFEADLKELQQSRPAA
jgi:ABC-type transporter Mla subunit MlaD